MALDILEAHPPSGSSGPPVLLVHGAWHGAWCWEWHMLPWLAQHGHDTYALDLRGHGRSANPRSLRRTSLADYVEDVAAAVARIGRPPVIVGHSMGGLVVERYLAGGGAAVGGVLLAPVPASGVLRLTLRIARQRPGAFLRANLTMSLWPIMESPEAVHEALLPPSFAPAEVSAVHARLQDESYRAFLGMLRPGVDLSRIRVPVLVIGAGADRMFTADEIEATARALGTEAEFIPGAAHDLMLDPAWERVAARIVEWIGDRLGAVPGARAAASAS
jgi:alpha-beta hydrolase superfamily lysophospholipase